MDTTLVTVTIFSMAMAAALSVIVWRLLREERRRSEARVAALTTAARPWNSGVALADADRFREPAAPPAAAPRPPAARKDVIVARDHAVAPRDAAPVPRKTSADDLPLHATAASSSASLSSSMPAALFAEPVRSSPWGHRVVVMAGIALLGTSVVLFALTAAGPRAAGPAAKPAAPASASTTGEPAVAGLELLSLRDTRQPDALTITGMVQNPRSGSLLTRVSVTAYAFDDKGAFLASGRALLDVTSLAPGDESPFVVAVPSTGTVARYRIGFRSEDGRVIAHVDKRQQSPIAALQTGAGRPNW